MSNGPKPRCPWRKRRRHPMDGAHKLANGFTAAVLGGIIIAYPAAEAAIAMLINESGSLAIWLSVVVGLMAVFWVVGYVAGDRFVDWMSENCTRMMHGRYH